jgi:putative phosphoesterase
MKIAVLSDVHDQTKNLSPIFEEIKKQNCEMVFALGDYISLKSFKELEKMRLPIYAVFGNMDKDRDDIESWARSSNKRITLRREMNRVKIGEENFALTHFPEIAEKLLKSGMYKAVFYGHTHKVAKRTEDETLIANPGAVQMGSFGIYDSNTNKFKIVRL